MGYFQVRKNMGKQYDSSMQGKLINFSPELDAILQKTYLNAFHGKNKFIFWCQFLWSPLRRVQLCYAIVD